MRAPESQQAVPVANMPVAGAAPPPLPLHYSMPAPKLWTVGTLVYTTGGLVLLFFWLLLGDFALSLRDRSVPPVVQLFLRNQGTSDTVMAILLSSLPPLLGMILSPIVSYRSDRLRTRWGRRIPFLIIPTPIAGLAMVGIACTPWIGQGLHSFLGGRFAASTCAIAVFGLFWTIFEVAVVVSAAVFGGLINDVVPRPVLGRFFGLFRAVSLIDGMIFNYFLLQRAESHFFWLLAAVAVVFGAGFVLMCLMVKEGQYPPPEEMDRPAPGFDVIMPQSGNRPQAAGLAQPAPLHAGIAPPPPPPPQNKFFAAIATYFRECYSKPYYLWCFAAFTLGAICFMPINLFSILYAKQLRIDMADYGKLVAGSYVVSLCLAYPLGMLVDLYHPVRIGLVTLILYAASTVWGALAIHDQLTFSIALVTHTVLSGSYFTATASLTQSLLPRSKFSQFASAGGIISSLATIAIGPIVGLILDHTDHNYRLTFAAGFVLATIAAGVLFVVYQKFMALGGPRHYVAPLDV